MMTHTSGDIREQIAEASRTFEKFGQGHVFQFVDQGTDEQLTELLLDIKVGYYDE